MVATSQDSLASPTHFVLRPNGSASWRTTKCVMALVVLVSLGIGVTFASLGLWVVLPFAGLESLAMALALYLCARRAGEREVITLGLGEVRVERGRLRPERAWTFSRAWIQVSLQPSPVPSYPRRLLLRSHGRWLEVGRFLNEDERHRLAKELQAAFACEPPLRWPGYQANG